MERVRQNPSLDNIIKLADALDVSLAELFRPSTRPRRCPGLTKVTGSHPTGLWVEARFASEAKCLIWQMFEIARAYVTKSSQESDGQDRHYFRIIKRNGQVRHHV